MTGNEIGKNLCGFVTGYSLARPMTYYDTAYGNDFPYKIDATRSENAYFWESFLF